ncbi:LutC/YkgG family protein [Goodfellowiella coeruleoviolacea]|uniref:L-lactate dehydrogenase complex protein LldG n=1 Tax=Goodfellowiella coeruleoviolacea TaxID=334858 RepID=A0AAE3GLG0_9PSEU|nr:LUD domain-containing protein [Goodfellowiella coeruleoviolacea]MCP2170447.1 L-lactate dehydrogenase complex protein LldG [Goodfellowiella coeruleoviolacea]
MADPDEPVAPDHTRSARNRAARAEVLARVRTALADRPLAPEIPRDYHRHRELPAGFATVLDLLDERVVDYRAVVHRVAEAELVDTIATVLAERGVRTMVGPADLPREWQVPGVTWRLDGASDQDGGGALSVSDLDGADGVLTGCALAIAETGTIVLDAGAAQGRRALTLVPDYHLCVVHANQVVGTVPEGVARLNPARPLTFISGPSATSDIELDRVEGVHGPRTLEVILVEPSA